MRRGRTYTLPGATVRKGAVRHPSSPADALTGFNGSADRMPEWDRALCKPCAVIRKPALRRDFRADRTLAKGA